MSFPYLVIIPLVVGLFTQTLKVVIQFSKKKRGFWKDFLKYGGMPSSHCAFLSALCTIIALSEGIDSAAFAICTIVSILIIRDAFGLRLFISIQAKTLNKFIRRLSNGERMKNGFPKYLEEKVGHGPLEIVVGVVIGVFLTLGLYYLFV